MLETYTGLVEARRDKVTEHGAVMEALELDWQQGCRTRALELAARTGARNVIGSLEHDTACRLELEKQLQDGIREVEGGDTQLVGV